MRPPSSLSDVLRPEKSAALMQAIGYSSKDIEDLHGSGILAMDVGALPLEDRLELLGSDPESLLSPHMDLNHFKPLKASGDVVLVDYYTGARLKPMKLGPLAVFGQRGLEPHPGPIWSESEQLQALRSRFNRIPVRAVTSRHQLDQELELFRKASTPRSSIFFRGQTNQYFVNRRPRVKEFLYGSCSAQEPSLPSTAYRRQFNYLAAERHWKAIVADIDYRLSGFADNRWWVEDDIEHVYLTSGGHIARWHRLSTMSISQHYGLPTFGLDVTTSLDTAWWFATHKFHERDDTAWYTRHEWHEQPTENWPVIYIFRSSDWDPIHNLELAAERPRRQAAVLAHGSWGVHGNIVADDLIAVFVLAPSFGVAPAETRDIFPSNDPFYRELLSLKASIGDKHPLYCGAGLKHVFEIVEPPS